MFPAASRKGSGSGFAFPDVCRVPAPTSPIPVPYPNMADVSMKQGHLANKVRIGGKKVIVSKSKIPISTGDQAGVSPGIISGTTMGPASIKMTKLMDYHHGEFLPPASGLMCQAPNCANAAEAYMPKNGQPVCLNCYHIAMGGAYPMPSQTKVMIAP